MARLRTFIAVELERTLRGKLVAAQEKLARAGSEVKWVEPDNLHVSLLFLGEVIDREVPAVCRVVSDCCQKQSAFLMQVEHIGCFPNPRRPRVLWAGIAQGTPELQSLHDAMEGPLLDLGCYRREDRAYTPHITLGRVKSDRPMNSLSESLAREADWYGGEMTVREVQVLSSELTSKGPHYTVLSRAKLRS